MSKFNINLIKIEKIKDMIGTLKNIEDDSQIEEVLDSLFNIQKKPVSYQVHFLTAKAL